MEAQKTFEHCDIMHVENSEIKMCCHRKVSKGNK